MKKLLLIIGLLLVSTVFAHTHIWLKQNETVGVDTYGNSVIICSWKCTYDYRNHHYAQTQGFGYCPMPSF